MVNVSASRQDQIAFWCVGALFLTAAAIYAIAGETRWPHWLLLSSGILVWAVIGYVQRSQKPAKFIINFLSVAVFALAFTGVIGLLVTRH